jgi:hypothetical protein
MQRFVLALCLLALAACSPGAASSTDQPQATAVVTVVAAATITRAATVTPAPPPTVTTVPQPTSTAPPTSFDKPGKVGQRLENGSTALTVITTTLTPQLDPAVPAKAGETYLVADVLLENTGAGPDAYDVIYFSVLDANGTEYPSVRGAPGPALAKGDLAPGDRTQGHVAFKIKPGAASLVVKYQPVTMGRSPRIYIAVMQGPD